MQYDFDTPVNRKGSGSLKWDTAEGTLPMWVADMDFRTAPEILEAMRKRLEHGVFGYSVVPEEWYRAIQGWWERRHGFHMEKEWLVFCTGVVPALSSLVRKMTTVGENVLVQTPVYDIFFHSIINNGRHVLESPLRDENGVYSVDFVDLEEKLARPQTTMMILCNPHNPVGKIWDRPTLERIGHLAAKHHVLVVSDEIHCDLTEPGKEYIPFASVSEECRENSVTCIAPTKTFNLAGLQTAAVCVPNETLRHKAQRGLNTDEVAEPNAFAITAAVAAFTRGEAWLEELRQYLSENKKTTVDFLRRNVPGVKAGVPEATYLLWLDCGDICEDSGALQEFLRKETGLYLSDGARYGGTGKHFLRWNAACPRCLLQDGLERFRKGVEAWLRDTGQKR